MSSRQTRCIQEFSLQLYSLNVSTLLDFLNGRFIQYHILSDERKSNLLALNGDSEFSQRQNPVR